MQMEPTRQTVLGDPVAAACAPLQRWADLM